MTLIFLKILFITFGFLNLILWFKAHVEKFSFKNQKLSEIILDI